MKPYEKDLEKHDCGDCGAKPDELHDPGCDVERCPECGGQIISCGCTRKGIWPEDDEGSWPPDKDRLPWTGIWPGVLECIEFGWFSKWVEGKGWVHCTKDDPEAGPDLNHLHPFGGATWDKAAKRWRRT